MKNVYHFPPDLFNLLVDAIPLMLRSKWDVLVFFRGAGAGPAVLSDLERKVREDRDRISKYAIVRTVLLRINENGDKYLKERREILKRVVEFEDFSTCWSDDRLKALIGCWFQRFEKSLRRERLVHQDRVKSVMQK